MAQQSNDSEIKALPDDWRQGKAKLILALEVQLEGQSSCVGAANAYHRGGSVGWIQPRRQCEGERGRKMGL